MALKSAKKGQGLFKGVFVAYMILLLHVLLVAAMGVLVLFFRGVVNYLPWIFAGAAVTLAGTIYLIIRQMKREGSNLRQTLSLPAFRGRAVEVSLLGGLASFKMSQPVDITPLALEEGTNGPIRQLEAPKQPGIGDLAEFARLLENDLITREEYEKAKEEIFHSASSHNPQWSDTDL